VGLTAIYVTHDQHEAFAIADQIALMNAGVFEQVGAPAELYRRPATEFAARFLGLNNVVPVEIAKTWLDLGMSADSGSVLLHPDGITLDAAGRIGGTVREVVFVGDAYRVEMQTPEGIPLAFKLPTRDQAAPKLNDVLRVEIAPEYVIPLKLSISPEL
jgi:putative spermidine/putrescine transport system ATP-binding protein